MLTTPVAGMCNRSRNELDSLEANGSGQVLILPTIKTVAAQLDKLETEFAKLEQELDSLIMLRNRLIALQERAVWNTLALEEVPLDALWNQAD